MKKFIFTLATSILSLTIYSQTTIDLTFTAVDGADYAQLDSIKVMNRTHSGDTVLYYPDTVLSLFVTGINESLANETGFHLFQNYPNPVKDQTNITLKLSSSGMVNITITDILGRMVVRSEQYLELGVHSFSFTPGNCEIYFFTARYNNENRSIKMLCSPIRSENKVSFNYIGSTDDEAKLNASVNVQSFLFNYGNELLYIGYYDTIQSGMLDSPDQDKTYTYQFAYNIPCLGTPLVEYEGQVYNTVQIMSQCWLKENLNVGTMIPGTQEMEDNDIVEKYCYDNEQDSCAKYGGLYQWDEMMQYTTQQGTQGICPPGWHLPTDEEWKVLSGTVDSQYGVGNPAWNQSGSEGVFCGFDAGLNLKSTSGWNGGGNGTDMFGFSALPCGFRYYYGSFSIHGYYGYWRTSSSWDRYLYYDHTEIGRHANHSGNGFLVRCVRDY